MPGVNRVVLRLCFSTPLPLSAWKGQHYGANLKSNSIYFIRKGKCYSNAFIIHPRQLSRQMQQCVCSDPVCCLLLSAPFSHSHMISAKLQCTHYLITPAIVVHFLFNACDDDERAACLPIIFLPMFCSVASRIQLQHVRVLCGAWRGVPARAHWNVEAFMLTFGTQGEWQTLPLHHNELFLKPI